MLIVRGVDLMVEAQIKFSGCFRQESHHGPSVPITPLNRLPIIPEDLLTSLFIAHDFFHYNQSIYGSKAARKDPDRQVQMRVEWEQIRGVLSFRA